MSIVNELARRSRYDRDALISEIANMQPTDASFALEFVGEFPDSKMIILESLDQTT